MTTPGAPYALLERILALASEALTDNDRPLPENVLITHNSPSWDCCDLLAVSVNQLKPTTRFPNQEGRELRGGIRFALEVEVTLLRCVPGLGPMGELPTNDALSLSAAELAADVWSIYHRLACAALDGSLVSDCECDNASLGNVTPLGPQGGCGGYRFLVTVELSGQT